MTRRKIISLFALIGILIFFWGRKECNCTYQITAETEGFSLFPSDPVSLKLPNELRVRALDAEYISVIRFADEVRVTSPSLPANANINCTSGVIQSICLHFGDDSLGYNGGHRPLEIAFRGRVMIPAYSPAAEVRTIMHVGKLNVYAKTLSDRPYLIAEHHFDVGDGFEAIEPSIESSMGFATAGSTGHLSLIWRFRGNGVQIFRGATVGDGNAYRLTNWEALQASPEYIALGAFAALVIAVWHIFVEVRQTAVAKSAKQS